MRSTLYRSSETELIRGCIRQEREAQQYLYEKFSPVLYAICLRYVRNVVEAEDVLVIAFTKIFDKISQFRGEGSFEGWMKRITIHEALTILRSKPNVFITSLDHQANDWIEPGAEDYDHLAEEELLMLIQQLPAGYRTVFNLYAIDGYSHHEIAEKLGISENTSKSQLSRARTILQGHLLKLSLKNTKPHGLTT